MTDIHQHASKHYQLYYRVAFLSQNVYKKIPNNDTSFGIAPDRW